MNEIELESKLVGGISGEFFIPAYQRGYRWNEEVTTLLDDVSAIPEGQNYCLQPVVVKKTAENLYELIDGQQRLTSIYLILKYLKELGVPVEIKFSIEYKTREGSKEFLESINLAALDKKPETIDEFFMIEAYRNIHNWFEKCKDKNEKINFAWQISHKFFNKVHVIWYQAGENEDSTDLFTRLNIGKIPLTNAELVKALFLSRKNGIHKNDQLEIATEWDTIEKELHDDSLWSFITNENAENYPTRIEILFDLISGKLKNAPSKTKNEEFYTFYHFSKEIQYEEYKNDKKRLWKKIKQDFEHLKEWYEDRELYHKIGYLIAANSIDLNELIQDSAKKTKNEIRSSIDRKIADSINFDVDYSELSYDKNYDDIEKLLLLFNVESTRCINDPLLKFPFKNHKNKQWSLEHIHAQQSDGLNTREDWTKWLKLHAKALSKHIDSEKYSDLISEMEQAAENEKLNKDQFTVLFEKAVQKLSGTSSAEYIHTLSNMALLGMSDNSVLSNSTFDVKRNKIIEMDKKGTYIPICTRRVFMKYYTSDDNQLNFWGENDRKCYISEMNRILRPYLEKIGKEIKI